MYHDIPLPQEFTHAFDAARALHGEQVGHPHELLNADRHRVVLLTLGVGDSLPEQHHLYAHKMLVVLEGCATLIRDAAGTVLHEGTSLALPPCTRHRLINTGKIPLRLLDIRSGACVAEDDQAN